MTHVQHMTHAARRRLNLSALERDLLAQLAREDVRWLSSEQLTTNLVHYEQPVVISALNRLRHRDLVTVDVRHLGGGVRWAITGLGDAAWRADSQLRLA